MSAFVSILSKICHYETFEHIKRPCCCPPPPLTQLGSDGVAEPVYKLDYLRLGCPTHLVSYERRT